MAVAFAGSVDDYTFKAPRRRVLDNVYLTLKGVEGYDYDYGC